MSNLRRRSGRAGFTLVELLVVISIIVVLLALLTPALDRALNQAELTLCGSNLKAIINGVVIYAADHKRHYPYRPVLHNYSVTPSGWLNWGGYAGTTAGGDTAIDDRIVFRDYLALNASLNCPLSTVLDISGSQPSSFTYSDYDLWFGFFYTGRTGMFKSGNRITAEEQAGPAEPNGSRPIRRYNLLAGDNSAVNYLNNWGYGGHPDADGVWPQQAFQDEPNPWDGTTNITLSWYFGTGSRGEVDLNYGYQDGSVARFVNVAMHPGDEPQMDYIPAFREPTTDITRTNQVPRVQ